MTVTRRNVWELGDDWAEPILWYARGVKAMKSRRLAEPTSWRFYAGIHGYNAARWRQLGAVLLPLPRVERTPRQFLGQRRHEPPHHERGERRRLRGVGVPPEQGRHAGVLQQHPLPRPGRRAPRRVGGRQRAWRRND